MLASHTIQTQDTVTEKDILKGLSETIEPENMIYKAGAENKILIFGEIHPMAQPKKLLAKTIKKLHREYGFNYLALEVGENFQPIVDEYLETGNELLLRKNPWTLFSPWHASEEHIKIYKAVYQINKRHENKMKIICMDYNPIEYSQDYDMIRDRDSHMMFNLNEQIFKQDADAKLIILIGAYHALKNNVWETMKDYDTYGIMFKQDPLGVHLENKYPEEIFSIYIDGIVPKDYDNNGFFLTDIGNLYQQHMITMPVVPFAMMVENGIIAELNVMKKIPAVDNFDGYIFTGEFEELKHIDIDKWNNKKDK